MSHAQNKTPQPIRFLFENSVFLIAGAILALVWANTDQGSYHKFVEFDIATVFSGDSHQDEATHSGEHGDSNDQTEGDDAVATHEEADEDHVAREVAEAGHEAGTAHDEAEAGDAAAASHGAASEEGGGSHGHGLTLHFLINDILMALFFAIAGKEVWEALLPGGDLANPRKAATPLLATLGGIVGPAGIYAVGVLLFSQWSLLGSGWAVPCATDIAFSYLVARLIFGAGHPAIAFLLLLAIADDAAGLIILAVFYPTGDLQLTWLLLSAAAVVLGFVFRKMRLRSFWWYLLIPGTMSWVSFYFAGIHPALGLVPIIPCMPHAHTDLGIFAREELGRHDTLNEFEHWWKNPVELILGMFGLVNAGVAMSNVGTGTWLVLAGLIVGKPLGITLFTWIGQKFFKLEIPGNMGYRHIVTLGMVAGIGFTVALFVSTAAFPVPKYPQEILDAVKMGALGSFFAAVVAIIGGRMLGIRPLKSEANVQNSGGDETSSETAAEASCSA